jgi:hypothetical protein
MELGIAFGDTNNLTLYGSPRDFITATQIFVKVLDKFSDNLNTGDKIEISKINTVEITFIDKINRDGRLNEIIKWIGDNEDGFFSAHSVSITKYLIPNKQIN